MAQDIDILDHCQRKLVLELSVEVCPTSTGHANPNIATDKGSQSELRNLVNLKVSFCFPTVHPRTSSHTQPSTTQNVLLLRFELNSILLDRFNNSPPFSRRFSVIRQHAFERSARFSAFLFRYSLGPGPGRGQ